MGNTMSKPLLTGLLCIHQAVAPDPGMNIYFRSPGTGEPRQVEVAAEATVGDLQVAIEDVVGEHTALSFDKRELGDDNQALADAGICSESTVEVELVQEIEITVVIFGVHQAGKRVVIRARNEDDFASKLRNEAFRYLGKEGGVTLSSDPEYEERHLRNLEAAGLRIKDKSAFKKLLHSSNEEEVVAIVDVIKK